MRRNFFWGLFFIIIGVVFLINRVFNMDIPTFTIICSFLLIFWGVSILIGKNNNRVHRENKQDTIFSQGEMKANEFQDKFDIIFSDNTVDLTALTSLENQRTIRIDCIFSRGLVKINPNIPMKIKCSSVFSSAHMPNGTSISFGDYTYATRSYNKGLPYYYVKVDVVFSHMDVVE